MRADHLPDGYVHDRTAESHIGSTFSPCVRTRFWELEGALAECEGGAPKKVEAAPEQLSSR